MVLVGCSSTSSVPEDDKLFTGLRKTEYENYVASHALAAAPSPLVSAAQD